MEGSCSIWNVSKTAHFNKVQTPENRINITSTMNHLQILRPSTIGVSRRTLLQGLVFCIVVIAALNAVNLYFQVSEWHAFYWHIGDEKLRRENTAWICRNKLLLSWSGANTSHSSVRNYWPCEISSYKIESHLKISYLFFYTKDEQFSLFLVAGEL
jgi:Ca2+/H+ antiporter